MNKRDGLINYGFKKVGEWERSEEAESDICFKFEEETYADKRVIYAFVVKNDVKYIGICDSRNTTLKSRMYNYKKHDDERESTNRRIYKKIKECLDQKKSVEIYALEPNKKIRYKDLIVDLVKGLENPLIEKLKPEWNIRK